MGFSTCYAVIVRSIAAPFKDVALAHVFDPGAIDFQLMISSVASDNKVTIEIARSKQEYTVQYHDEPGQLEHPNKYFKKTDRIYQNLFMKN